MDWIANLNTTLTGSHWVLQAFIVILGTAVLQFMLRRVLRKVQRRLEEGTRTPWDDAFVGALRRPLAMMVWILGIAFAVEIAHRATGATIFEVARPARDLGVIATIVWFLLQLVRNGQVAYLTRHKGGEAVLDPVTLDAITKLLRISVLITGSLVTLQTLGFSISGVLAFGGIGGIAIGFAAKDLLSNFFGGLMIYLDRPFALGDWIRSPDREIEGTVEAIGWRLTTIRTFDKRPLYVPNAVFSTVSVENPSRMKNRRIYETIGIRYDDAAKMADIVHDVKAMLLEHPEIDTGQTMIVNFNAFAPSSLDFFIYTFTKTREWIAFHGVKQDVLLKVIDIIDGHGAQIAFPTSTIHLAHLEQEPDGEREDEETLLKGES